MKNLYNKMRIVLDLVDLLEAMHVNKESKNTDLSKEKINEIKRSWYLDKLIRTKIDNFFVVSKRKI